MCLPHITKYSKKAVYYYILLLICKTFDQYYMKSGTWIYNTLWCKRRETKKTGIFNRFMNGHIQLVLSWWAGILLLACKQLAFALQFSLWYPFTQRQKCFSTYEPFSATNFLLISCPMVPDRREVKSTSLFINSLSVDCHPFESIFYSILGLTWHEVLTIERIYAR